MLPVMGSAIPADAAVVDAAVPRPGASAAEWRAASQESAGAIRVISRNQLCQDCVDALDSLLEERFAALGEPGITRPKDALRFTNNLEYKSGAQPLCHCMFCNTRVVSTGASRVLDHLLGCVLCPARVKQPLKALSLRWSTTSIGSIVLVGTAAQSGHENTADLPVYHVDVLYTPILILYLYLFCIIQVCVFPPPQEDWRLINGLLTNYHASRHGLRHTGRRGRRRRRRASPWRLRC